MDMLPRARIHFKKFYKPMETTGTFDRKPWLPDDILNRYSPERMMVSTSPDTKDIPAAARRIPRLLSGYEKTALINIFTNTRQTPRSIAGMGWTRTRLEF